MSKSRPSSKSLLKSAAKTARGAARTRASTPRAKRRGATPLSWQQLLARAAALLAFVATVSTVFAGGILWYYSRDLPSADALRHYRPPQTTRIVDRQGKLLSELFNERRTVVSMKQVPRVLVLSVLAAEDADFYHHSGMDLPGLGRVLWKAAVHGRPTQGASTITQQVVKNLLLTPERTIERKLKELILARRIESELTKDEILSLYLNHINFGHGRYGVQEAARYYFGKDVSQLNLAEASLIAGIPQSPTRLSPRTHPEAARRRQMFVLSQLEAKRTLYWDDLPLEEIEEARRRPPKIVDVPELSDVAPEMSQLGKEALIQAVGESRAREGGYTVVTSIDYALQREVRSAVQQGLREFDARHGHTAPLKLPRVPDKRLRRIVQEARVDHPKRKRLKVAGAYDAVVLPTSDKAKLSLSVQGVLATALVSEHARFNPERLSAPQFAPPGTRVRVSISDMPPDQPVKVRLALGPEAAAIVIDPRSREVLALVGGYDAAPGFNRATQALRQPGSTFKALVYALAIQTRRYTPATLVLDAPGVYDKYKPSNYETWTYEGAVRLRHGLAKSINSVAVRVADDLGPAQIVDFARQLGITTPLEPSLSLALGASEVHLSELTNVYATFAAGGRYVPLNMVRKIKDASGRAASVTRPGSSRDVLTPAEAYVVTSLLTSVVQEGTGARAKALGIPLAGKTGTSNRARDAWFVGYSDSLVAGVWVGYDDHRPLGAKEGGSRTALPLWITVMKAAGASERGGEFPMPTGVVVEKIDPQTGLLAYEGQPDAVDEVFLEGTVPTEQARPPDVVDPTTFMMEQLGASYGL